MGSYLRRYFNPVHSALVVLIVSVLAVFFTSQLITAQELGSGGIGGRPAFPRDDNPRSESIFVHTLNNGESVSDGVLVINNTEVPKTVLVYGTDSVDSSGGAFACAQFVDEAVDVGSWIALESSSIELEPGTSEVIDFTINVPETADAGEHNGCIVIEEDLDPAETTQGIGLNFRTAVRTAVLVPGDLSRTDLAKLIEITNFTASVKTDEIITTPTIENVGLVSVDTNIETSIKTIFGNTLSTVGGEFPVLRTQTGEWNFSHPKPMWGGWYKASVTASYDENPDNFIGEGESSTITITREDITLFIFPSGAGLGILLIGFAAICGFFILLWKRKKKRDHIQDTWVKHTLKKGVSIKSIAKTRGVHWKEIAKVNKIKPPYYLEAGQTILIPPKKDR